MSAKNSPAGNIALIEKNPDITNYGSRRFFYNNALFIAQCGFGFIVILFSAGMLMAGHPAEVYLPILASVCSAFLPSPLSGLSHQPVQTSSPFQIRDILDNVV
jgi:hypothetical protein